MLSAFRDLSSTFRHLIPGIVLLAAAWAAHRSWFDGFDLGKGWHVATLVILAVAAGNVFYVLHRYTLHQLLDIVCYRLRTGSVAGYRSWLYDHIFASFIVKKRECDLWQFVHFRSAQVIVMFLVGEVLCLFALWHEPGSVFSHYPTQVGIAGVLLLVVAGLQGWLGNNLDINMAERITKLHSKGPPAESLEPEEQRRPLDKHRSRGNSSSGNAGNSMPDQSAYGFSPLLLLVRSALHLHAWISPYSIGIRSIWKNRHRKVPFWFGECYTALWLVLLWVAMLHAAANDVSAWWIGLALFRLVDVLLGNAWLIVIEREETRDDMGYYLFARNLNRWILLVLMNVAEITVAFALLYLRIGGQFRTSSFPGGIDSCAAALYQSLLTLTTLGYGELYPATTLARILVMFQLVYFVLFILLVVPAVLSGIRVREKHPVWRN